MNTSMLLFQRSAEMPEGLYLELMNNLKKDFDNVETAPPPVRQIIIINKNIPRIIAMRKDELLEQVIKNSHNWIDRDNFLVQITNRRYSWWMLRELCVKNNLPIMKENPKWIEQEEIMNRNAGFRHEMRRASPGVINL
jgi:hypothetical protein